MKIILSHPMGNQFARALLVNLYKKGMLKEFITTIAVKPDDKFISILPAGIRRDLMRREYPVPFELIFRRQKLEFARMIFSKLNLQRFIAHEKGWASVDAVYHDLDNIVAGRLDLLMDNDVKAVYSYEDGALSTFKKAKKLGLKCIYDLPIAYWETGRKLMMEEADRLPNWAATLAGGILDSVEKLKRKEQELELADSVVVPGKFVMDSLPEWALKKNIIVAPFGTPSIISSIANKENEKSTRPLRVLFVGSMSQRKGLGDLFEAVKTLNSKNIELIVMGGLIAPLEFYKNEFNDFVYETGRPHSEVLNLMRSCDVFCLPSIVEGRALVMQEAMSQGLPLIITPNTGGEDLVEEGKTGFLVPIRSPEMIAEKLCWCLANRAAVVEMGIAAQAHAMRYTWERYSNTIVNGIKDSF